MMRANDFTPPVFNGHMRQGILGAAYCNGIVTPSSNAGYANLLLIILPGRSPSKGSSQYLMLFISGIATARIYTGVIYYIQS